RRRKCHQRVNYLTPVAPIGIYCRRNGTRARHKSGTSDREMAGAGDGNDAVRPPEGCSRRASRRAQDRGRPRDPPPLAPGGGGAGIRPQARQRDRRSWVPAVSAATGHDGVMSLRLQLVVAVVLAVLAAFNIVAMFNMKPSYGAGSTARATADQRVVGVNAVRGVRCVSACDRSIAAR